MLTKIDRFLILHRKQIREEKRLILGVTISFGLLAFIGITFMFPSVDNRIDVNAADRDIESNANISVTTGGIGMNMTLPKGSFTSSKEEDKSTFNIITNNYTGYTLTLSGGNDNGDLVSQNEDASFSSITSQITSDIFEDSSYNGKWGIQPSKYHSKNNTDFIPVPTTMATVLDVTNRPNDTANSYSIGVGARAGLDAIVGTYTASLILNITGNPVTYAISYADNTGDITVEDLPPVQSSVISSSDIILSSKTPHRDNYTFLTWCYGDVGPNGVYCDGRTYEPGSSFNLDQADDNIPILYAVWSPNIAIKTNPGISSITLDGHTCDPLTDQDASTIGCVIRGLNYSNTYHLSATVEEGYNFDSWDAGGSGSISPIGSPGASFTVGEFPTTISPSTTSHTYTIGLVNTDATTPGSTIATVAHGSHTVSNIVNPRREYTISGFIIGPNNSDGASTSSESTVISGYGFAGWYDGNKRVITRTGALDANTAYTDAFGRWSATTGATLYAHWDEVPVSLPTIHKEGWTCGWSTSSNTTDIEYASGYNIVATSDMTLYGVCTETGRTITFKTFDAESIEFNGEIYYDNQSVKVLPGTYSIRGNYAPRYTFLSWNYTAGNMSNIGYVNYNLNQYTVEDDATIYLTGQYVETALQDLDSLSCTEVPMPTYDTRDNQVYWVQRLGDDNCWMMDNLNLGATKLSTDLTSTNTNITSNVSASTFNRWKSESSASATSASYIPITAENSADGSDIDHVAGNKYGTLYNYCAATAGTYCTNSGSGDATQDLCPAGWRLPVGGTSTSGKNEYYNLYVNHAHGNKSLMITPISEGGLAFAIGGFVDGNDIVYQGSLGGWWTASRRVNDTMFAMGISIYDDMSHIGENLLDFNTDGGGSREVATSVRCIHKADPIITFRTINADSIEFNGVTYHDGDRVEIKPGTYSVVANFGPKYTLQSWSVTTGEITNSNYVDYYGNKYTVTGNATITLTGKPVNTVIQNFPESSCTSTPTATYDTRDGQVYYVQRLADGNCWMLDSLNLGARTLLSDFNSSNTNISFNISRSTFNSWKTTTYINDEYETPKWVNSTDIEDINHVDTYSGTKTGVLYNFCAASGETTCTEHYTPYTITGDDLCPAGWKLPKGGPYGVYKDLYAAYNSEWQSFTAPVSEGGAAFHEGYYFTSQSHWNPEMVMNVFIMPGNIWVDNAVNCGRGDDHYLRCVRK